MESEEHEAVMFGRVDEDTVFVSDNFLVLWCVILYGLGIFTGQLLFFMLVT
jgi:hypothetical protein